LPESISEPNREPKEEVKSILRKEVGFSCPVTKRDGTDRCGNPFLSWHHFDPPWHVMHHQNPEGMIALCRDHHDSADGGAYTKEQLRTFKERTRNQFVEIERDIRWMRDEILSVVGGTLYYKNPIIFHYRGNPVIWYERDDNGFLLLNIDLRPITSHHRLLMRNNFWHIDEEPEDLICPPSGKKIDVRYKDGDKLLIEFSNIESESDKKFQKFQKEYPNVSALSSLSFPLTTVEVTMTVKEKGILFNPKETRFNGGRMIGVVIENNDGPGLSFG